MHMVDDATTKALGCFSEEETVWAGAAVLRRWIERYGTPQVLYTDWKSLLDHRLDGSTISLLRVAAAQIASPLFRVVRDTISGAS
jgi:hypothetical protein